MQRGPALGAAAARPGLFDVLDFTLRMSDLPDRPPPLVPSHIAWPAFVVFLLVFSVSMAMVTVFAALSDGGARPAAESPMEAAVEALPDTTLAPPR